MKKLYTLLVLLFAISTANSQIVNIPDANFKAKLLQSSAIADIAYNSIGTKIKIDQNDNGDIEISEALEVYRLNLNFGTISNLEGIASFANLRYLYCNNNQILELNLSSLINLRELECYSNQLVSINVSGLTNLQIINCLNNSITSLDLSGLTSLYSVRCSQNQLTSLNLSGLINLQQLFCEQNLLTSLDVNDSIYLTILYCMDNQLTTIDVSELRILYTLYCQGNQLTSLFIKNGAIESSLVFGLNPNIQYICADEDQVTAIQNLIGLYGYSNCHVTTYCSFTPGGIFYNVNGSHKFDIDNNGCDNNDIIIPNQRFSVTNGTTSGTVISNLSGDFTIPVSSGTFTITPILENSDYFTISPSSITVTFPDTASPFTQNFCLSSSSNLNDLEVVLFPISPARPGFDAVYKVVCKNKGNQVQSGSVTLEFEDDYIDLVSANPIYTNQNTGILSWDIINLQPFETRQITVTFNINSPTETPSVNNGDQLDFSSTINPIIGDENPQDNVSALKQIVVGSYDPNDKTCLEGTTITPGMVGQYVHYIIRFENTGTFAAENIVVADVIDVTKFDLPTLIPQSSSHNFVTRINNTTNKVEFIFENINLPFDDANNDGYVAFKIKTKPTLVVGNTFSNSASIYFDYNFPIITDTYTTTVQALGNQDFEFNSVFSLSPVPTKDILTITAKESLVMSSVSIYNTLGQLVQVATSPDETIDVSGLPSGSYFIKIVSDRGSATGKFIKE
ncbi:T9SS type A sorting domain-containing protein [Flavobacterium sp.]|uniref:DUF7619 domain-containing protein n=1 Tax=Flavobacterium sp. TaxID=239 RepID=UPI003919ACA1